MGRKTKQNYGKGPANNKGRSQQPKPRDTLSPAPSPTPPEPTEPAETGQCANNKTENSVIAPAEVTKVPESPPIKDPEDEKEDFGKWCHHIIDSNTTDLLKMLHKPRRCNDCQKPGVFSCIHTGCVRNARTNCCGDVKHIFPHITTHNHPAILHHELELIVCTRCDIQAPVEHFLKHHASRAEADRPVKVEKNLKPENEEDFVELKGLMGYVNYGNTCYMNAVLQLLNHCPPFAHYMINLEPPGGWKRCPADVSKTVIQFAADLRRMNSPAPNPGFINPWKVLQCIRQEMPDFEVFQQQDASEFLRNLLDIFDRDLKACARYHRDNEVLAFGNPDYDYEFAMRCRTIKTAVTAHFQGVLENQIRCHSCGFRSTTSENFLDLSIPILSEDEFEDIYITPKKYKRPYRPNILTPNNKEQDGMDPGYLVNDGVNYRTSLDECLDMFFQSSELCGDNKYSCGHCKKLVDATKTTKAKQLPHVILIQLKRFRHTVYGSCKIGKLVDFPVRSQDFGRWTTTQESAIYDLVGFVVHDGRNMEFGHYVTFTKNELENQWYKFDDLIVKRFDEALVAKNSPYILMYKKRAPDLEPGPNPFDFFRNPRILNDKDTEAWEVIAKSIEDNYLVKEEDEDEEDTSEILRPGRRRQPQQRTRRTFTKTQRQKILAKTDVSPADLMQHIEDLENILEDLTLFSSKTAKAISSRSARMRKRSSRSKTRKTTGPSPLSHANCTSSDSSIEATESREQGRVAFKDPEFETNQSDSEESEDSESADNKSKERNRRKNETHKPVSARKEYVSKSTTASSLKTVPMRSIPNQPETKDPMKHNPDKSVAKKNSKGKPIQVPRENPDSKLSKAPDAKTHTKPVPPGPKPIMDKSMANSEPPTQNMNPKSSKSAIEATSDEGVHVMSQYEKPRKKKRRDQTPMIRMRDVQMILQEQKDEIDEVVASLDRWLKVVMYKEWDKYFETPEPSPESSPEPSPEPSPKKTVNQNQSPKKRSPKKN